MISNRIKTSIENNQSIKSCIDIDRIGENWSDYTRTIFMAIAKEINKIVTQKVILQPGLVTNNLLIGEHEIDKILFKEQHNSIDEFVQALENIPSHRTHNWISGKTLQSYWNGTNAKDKKLNVLLTFLDVEQSEWDIWKSSNSIMANKRRFENSKTFNNEHSNYLLKKYYLGSYFRYYQKVDSSSAIIKTPFVIKEDKNGNVIAESKTMGHRYKSYFIEINAGAMYLNFKNIDWDEKENHIFNIGIATSPKVLIGVSNSLNNRKQAIAKRNVLIRQDTSFDYEKIEGTILAYDMKFEKKCNDSIVVDFFKRRKSNLIITSLYYNMNELETLNHHPI